MKTYEKDKFESELFEKIIINDENEVKLANISSDGDNEFVPVDCFELQ